MMVEKTDALGGQIGWVERECKPLGDIYENLRRLRIE